MENEAHDLISEFPEYREQIHELKTQDNHFRNLFDQYHEVNREVHRIEQGVEAHADEYTEDLKKKRLDLKDQLFDMLKQAAA